MQKRNHANCGECPLNQNPRIENEPNPKAKYVLAITNQLSEADAQCLRRGGLGNVQYDTASVLGCSFDEPLSTKERKRAVACCAPAFKAELASNKKPIITYSNEALQCLINKTNVYSWRGYKYESEYGDVYPILPPFRTFGNPAMLPILEKDIRCIGEHDQHAWPPTFTSKESDDTRRALERISKSSFVSVDIESAREHVLTLIDDKVTCIGLSDGEVAVSVKWDEFTPKHIKALVTDILASEQISKVFHNGTYDRTVLANKQNGVRVCGDIHDTLLQHHTVAPQLPHDLGFAATTEFFAPRWKELEQADFTEHQVYNARDAFMTHKLLYALTARLKGTHKGEQLYEDAMALQPIVIAMQTHGCAVDQSVFGVHRNHLSQKADLAGFYFRELVPDTSFKLGANGSHPSLKKLFFKKLGVDPIKYSDKTGNPMLDDAVLNHIKVNSHAEAKAIAAAVLAYRKPTKLISTYIDGLPLRSDGRIHPHWKIHGTITGRWSSSDPNFQNIPKPMRNMFVATPNCVIAGADYSALELRLIALLAGDEILLTAFNDMDAGKKADVHKINASGLFNKPVGSVTDKERQMAKTFVYLAIYGGSANKLRDSLAIKGFDLPMRDVTQLLRNWNTSHPWIKRYHRHLLSVAENEWYVEEGFSGRREYFHNGIAEYNKVLNFPVQGAAGTLMNAAIRKVFSALNPDEHIIAQVHDAAYTEGPKEGRLKEILKECMTQSLTINGNTLKFPVDSKSGPNMRDCG